MNSCEHRDYEHHEIEKFSISLSVGFTFAESKIARFDNVVR